MLSSQPAPLFGQWTTCIAAVLDCRSAPRFAFLLLGTILAKGRRTVTSWIRAAGIAAFFRPAYTALAAAGRRTDAIATTLVSQAILPLVPPLATRVVFAIDDTPTARFGPKVRGAGVHHNPTPGPAGSAFVYGHVWVVLALLATHPAWGCLALPLLARLYVRQKDISSIPQPDRPEFRTKLQMAVELLRWAAEQFERPGLTLWAVADGAYAAGQVLKEAKQLGITVVSRLRKDCALHTLPEPRVKGQKGRPRIYGEKRIDLAKRAGQKRGWTEGKFTLYGKEMTKKYKSFPATWEPAGGTIRVVLLCEEKGWVAFFCTDTSATVADILGCVADRFGIETAFREVKQQVGAGQQQVRKLAANVGAFHACLWSYTLVEAWAWSRESSSLADRSDSPWDDATRRPSHADKRRALRRELLAEEIKSAVRDGADEAKIGPAVERLLALAA